MYNRLSCIVYCTAFLFIACKNSNAPLDADTRERIDSISNAQIKASQIELDSVCLAAQKTTLPVLVDSIKKIRLSEIEQQLKTIPK